MNHVKWSWYLQMIWVMFRAIYFICIGNHMSASAINDLHHEWCLKIVPKLHEP